jgi:hypothetical protein
LRPRPLLFEKLYAPIWLGLSSPSPQLRNFYNLLIVQNEWPQLFEQEYGVAGRLVERCFEAEGGENLDRFYDLIDVIQRHPPAKEYLSLHFPQGDNVFNLFDPPPGRPTPVAPGTRMVCPNGDWVDYVQQKGEILMCPNDGKLLIQA